MTITTNNYGFRFKEWDIYKDARELRIEINELLKNYPKEEKYALIDQTKRALNSIIINIAEGANKNTDKDMRVYINRAHCSLDEVIACLDCALDDEHITEEQHLIALEKASSLAKRLNSFTAYLSKSTVNSQQSIVHQRLFAGGQSLVEVLIAIGIGAILIGAATATIISILRSNLETRTVQIAGSLAQEYLDNLQSLAEQDWNKIHTPPAAKGSNSRFHLTATGTTFILVSGSTSTIAEGRTFTRHFSIENVNRNLCGASDITANATTSCVSGPGSSGVAEDPSTQKITSIVSWTAGGSAAGSINKVQYLTRSQNKVFVQSNWSEGPGQEGPITSENNRFATSTNVNHSITTGSIMINL